MHKPPALALLLAAGIVGSAHAQPDSGDPGAPDSVSDEAISEVAEGGGDIKFNFHASTTYYDEADFDDANGTIESWSSTFGVGAATSLGDGRISLGIDAELINYDYTGTGNASDDVTILTLSSTYTGQLESGNAWFVGATVSSARESGAEFDDSIAGMIFGGYRHKVSDTLELGIGLAIRSRLEDDVLIIPLPQIRYDMGGGWVLSSQRAGVKLMYAASDALSVGVSGEFESRSFRLDTANAVPGGAATHTGFPVAFQAEYKPSRSVMLSGRVGAALASEIEFFDSSGNSVNAREFDSAVFFGFSGTIFF